MLTVVTTYCTTLDHLENNIWRTRLRMWMSVMTRGNCYIRIVAVLDLEEAAGCAIVATDSASIAAGLSHHDCDYKALIDADIGSLLVNVIHNIGDLVFIVMNEPHVLLDLLDKSHLIHPLGFVGEVVILALIRK